MHDISVAAVAALFVLACQGKSTETKVDHDHDHDDDHDHESPQEPERAGGGLVVDEAKAPSAAIDCAKLLTTRDLYNMCGIESDWIADPFETGKGPTTCSRHAGEPERRLRFKVGVYPHLESARSVSRSVAEGDVEVETRRGRTTTSSIAHMRRGNTAISVASTQAYDVVALCDNDQLSKLALVIESRLF